jgi:hypothetical protein
VTLDPGFEQCERVTYMSGHPQPILVLPAVCLVVRIDGHIVAVAPHQAERSTYTVSDAMADIEAQPRFPESIDPSEVPPGHPARSISNPHSSADSSDDISGTSSKR